MTLTDIFGQEVKVGDWVAAGMALHRSSVLRVGKIVDIKESNKYNNAVWNVRIRWTHNGRSNYSWDVKESAIRIEASHSYAKIVKMPADYVEQFPYDNLKEGE